MINNDPNKVVYLPPPIIRQQDQSESTLSQSIKILEQTSFQTFRWNERTIAYLDEVDSVLDRWRPDWVLQKRLDNLGSYIQDKFSDLKDFNTWLRSNGNGCWYEQVATYLAKLPLRAAVNIITMLYNTIKSIIYTAVHPLKGLNHIAKQIINLIHALTDPKTWSKIGAGVMGFELGFALVLSNPISTIAMGIGSALLLAGVSVGALKAALTAELDHRSEHVGNHLLEQLKQIPETFLTSFFMGLIVGGIQRLIPHRITTAEEAREYADKFVKEHNLPPPDAVYIDKTTGNINLIYGKSQSNYDLINSLLKNYPDIAHYVTPGTRPWIHITLRPYQNGGGFLSCHYGEDFEIPFDKIGL